MIWWQKRMALQTPHTECYHARKSFPVKALMMALEALHLCPLLPSLDVRASPWVMSWGPVL